MIDGSTDTQKLLDKAKHTAVQQASYLFNQFIKSHQDIEDFEDTKDSECSNTTH